MFSKIIPPAVTGALVLGEFAGIWLFFGDSFVISAKKLKFRRGLASPAVTKEYPAAVLQLQRLASSVLQRDVPAMALPSILAAVFFSVAALCSVSFTLPAAVLCGFVAAAIPLVLLRIKLSEQQSKSSREGIALVTELSRQYRMNSRNIFKALECTVSCDGDFAISKKHLYRLLIHLRAAASKDEIRSSCESFAFSMGTVWAEMLSVCIRVSAEKGSDVSEGLSDIASQLKTANRRAEERKRLNSESGRMTLILVPLLYIATMAVSVGYLGISPSELLKNQFLTKEGVLFFMMTVFLFFFNMAVLKLIGMTKLDY